MKLSCTQENLYSGLNTVAHVANRSATLPILSNILLRTTKTGLELVATNLEVAVVTIVRGKIEQEGAVAINARLITDSVSLFPKEHVDIELQGTDLILNCGKHHTTIHGTLADEFPVIPELGSGGGITTTAGDLESALTQVVFAINPDENRPEIAGVYFARTAKGMVVVGTDSYRLAECLMTNIGGKTNLDNFIVPLRAAQEVMRVVGGAESDTEVEIINNETQTLWRLGETKIISRLVSGQYPDYQQIIPKEFTTKTVVPKDEFLRAVRAASLFVRAGINDVKIDIDPQSKIIKVSSTNTQLGENTTEFGLVSGEGGANEIVFNYKYLLEGLQAITTNEVVFEVVGPKNPGVFKPNSEAGYVYIIMPIRQ
jgi:DNA polymerase III subunit beta